MKFKEGEWAWSPFDGWKKIEIDPHSDKCIEHGECSFYEDGTYHSDDVCASLLTEKEANEKGILRLKDKKKIKMYQAILHNPDVNEYYVSTVLYPNEEMAMKHRMPLYNKEGFMDFICLINPVEIEVEE